MRPGAGGRVPPGGVRLPRSRALILWHVLTAQHATVRSCMDAAGLASSSTAHGQLRRLRDLGLVEWDEGRHGTIRPAVGIVRPLLTESL